MSTKDTLVVMGLFTVSLTGLVLAIGTTIRGIADNHPRFSAWVDRHPHWTNVLVFIPALAIAEAISLFTLYKVTH